VIPKRCTSCGQPGHYAPRCPTPDVFERERREQKAPVASEKPPRRFNGQGSLWRSVNATAAEWAAIDRAAERVQMNRSEFLRQAAKRFMAHLWPTKES